MFSFLREDNKSDNTPGPFSARRIAAFLMIFMAVPMFILAFQHSEHGWPVYIPGGLCLVLAVVLFLFTTLTDLKGIVEAASGFGKKA